jgi:hypothetical protein
MPMWEHLMGAKRAVPYIHRHPKTGHLNYRRRIPATVRPFIKGQPREFVRTLAAHSITDPGAVDRQRAAELEYDVMIAKARKAAVSGVTSAYDALTPTLIAFLADYYYALELQRDEQARWGRSPLKVPYATRDSLEQDYIDSRELLSGYDGIPYILIWGFRDKSKYL